MGDDVPIEEPPWGFCNDCVQCFPVGECPCHVQLVINDVERCPDSGGSIPNGRNFTLEQRFDIDPCYWYVEVDGFEVGWTASPAAAGVRSDGWDVFIGLGDPCDTGFSNESICVPGAAGTGGTATITWGPGINQAAFDAQ